MTNSQTGDELRDLARGLTEFAAGHRAYTMAHQIISVAVDHLTAIARAHDFNAAAPEPDALRLAEEALQEIIICLKMALSEIKSLTLREREPDADYDAQNTEATAADCKAIVRARKALAAIRAARGEPGHG